MALVKCPECGKEVSDTAVFCPGCGYAVKDHFAKTEEVKKEDEPVKISAKLVECKKCGAKLNQGTEMCFKCGASLEQKGNSENNTINNRKPEPENQVTIGLGLVALAFISLFLPFIQLGNISLSLSQIQLVLPILGFSLGLTAIFVINKKKSGVIAMNVFSILFTAFVYYAEFADNSDLSRYVSPGVGAFLLPIALIAIWVYYAKLRKEYGLAPNDKPIKGGRIVLGVILGFVILIALLVVVGLIRKAIRDADSGSNSKSDDKIEEIIEEKSMIEQIRENVNERDKYYKDNNWGPYCFIYYKGGDIYFYVAYHLEVGERSYTGKLIQTNDPNYCEMTSKGYKFTIKLENGDFIIKDGIAEYDVDLGGTYSR